MNTQTLIQTIENEAKQRIHRLFNTNKGGEDVYSNSDSRNWYTHDSYSSKCCVRMVELISRTNRLIHEAETLYNESVGLVEEYKTMHHLS